MIRPKERFYLLFAIVLVHFDCQKYSYIHAFTAGSYKINSKCTYYNQQDQRQRQTAVQYQEERRSDIEEDTYNYVKDKYNTNEGLLESMMKEKNDLLATKEKLQANKHHYLHTFNKRKRKRENLIERIRYCQNFEELLALFQYHTTVNNVNNTERMQSSLRHYHLSFFWNQASRFLYNKEEREKMTHNKNHQYEAFFQPLVKRTVLAFDSDKGYAAVHTANPKSIAATVYAISKISSRIDNTYDRRSSKGRSMILSNIQNEEELWNVLEKNVIDHIIATTAKDDNNDTTSIIRKEFSSQDCANILWSFAKIGRKSDRLFDVMTDQLLLLVRKGRDSADDDTYIIGEELLNSQDIAKIIWSYAKVNYHDNSSSISSKKKKLLLDTLSQMAVQKIDKFDSKSLANMLWAYAKVGHSSSSSKELFEVASQSVIRQISQFRSSQTITNTMWAYAKMMGDHSTSSPSYLPKLFDVLTKAAIRQIHTYSSQALANTVWSCAKVGHTSPELFDAISREAIQKMDRFSSQNIANMVWAYTKVATSTPLTKELFNAAARSAIERIDTFKSQELGNMLWSYAKAGHSAPELFDAAALQSANNLGKVKYSPQTISNMLWAYVTMGYSAPELFGAISKVAIEQMDAFNSQTISNTVWAYTKAGHAVPDLFNAASKHAIEKVDTFESQNIANTVWAYATMGHSAPDLFHALSQSAIKRDLLMSFNSQAISNTVWAYAKAGHMAPELFDAASQSAVEQINAFNSQAISNTVWAYTKAGHVAPELFSAVIELDTPKRQETVKKMIPSISLQTKKKKQRRFPSN